MPERSVDDEGQPAPTRAATSYAAVDEPGGLQGALASLKLRAGRPVLVLLGGASGLADDAAEVLRPLFEDAVSPVAERLGAIVIDGGTDAGVMRLMGRARARSSSRDAGSRAT